MRTRVTRITAIPVVFLSYCRPHVLEYYCYIMQADVPISETMGSTILRMVFIHSTQMFRYREFSLSVWGTINVSVKYSKVLLSTIKYYRVIQSIAGYNRVLLITIEYCKIQECTVEYNRVLQSTIQYCKYKSLHCMLQQNTVEWNRVRQSTAD